MAETMASKGPGHEEKGEEAGMGNSLERTWPLRTWQRTEPVCGKQSVKLECHPLLRTASWS